MCHDDSERAEHAAVSEVLQGELHFGMQGTELYRGFQQRADEVKNEFLTFLLSEKAAGRTVVGYGAAAKGNTFLNRAGIKQDLLSYVVDASPYKQGKYLPGSRIPIASEGKLQLDQPDTIVILPWNLRAEIANQLAYARVWGAQFAVAIPRLERF